MIEEEVLQSLSESSRNAVISILENTTINHSAGRNSSLTTSSVTPEWITSIYDTFPKRKTAAVLILLFERQSVLRVLLTTRSKHLRTHPGQTALPGGKSEPGDIDNYSIARREAYEECGLPLECKSLHHLRDLPPFLSQWKILVTPVIALLTDNSILDHLTPNADEVDTIFSHPLEAILDPTLAANETLSDKGSENWPYEEDLYSTSDSKWALMRNSPYRMHRFRSEGSPIKGLTSDILLLTAEIAYKKIPTFERWADSQPPSQQLIDWTIEDGTINVIPDKSTRD